MQPKINPLRVTNYNRSDAELEQFFLYAVLVAGKRSEWASETTAGLLATRPAELSPLTWLARQDLPAFLRKHRTGQYRRISRAVQEAAALCLRSVSCPDLEAVYGVGPKTARFFLLHSRPGIECVPLDTHILAWLRDCGIRSPATTPQSLKRYRELEQAALRRMRRDYPHLTPAQADLLLWSRYARRAE